MGEKFQTQAIKFLDPALPVPTQAPKAQPERDPETQLTSPPAKTGKASFSSWNFLGSVRKKSGSVQDLPVTVVRKVFIGLSFGKATRRSTFNLGQHISMGRETFLKTAGKPSGDQSKALDSDEGSNQKHATRLSLHFRHRPRNYCPNCYYGLASSALDVW
ncbi:hypothetical protein GALMADRAFT_1260086 [Galerina marginata CBS 339.88]|uniref:Uncharacterized protein n=1 Tax=Galerina marginata (strain CBS 339.88) TaxID=685588 RepID=A0A067TFF6_GALM3|nr:hypothetical protein GALMADRAFT_1260086 [Galerina marginata CBS 339.88]